MALYSKKNPYPGINIHLNSFLQSESGDWVSYHSNHITHLREYLDQNLPENYYALSEYGLQIGGFDAGTGWETRSKLRPDITITKDPSQPNQQSYTEQTNTPTGTLSLIDTLSEPDELIGLVIYHISNIDEQAKPIARVELLSPANKIGGSYHNEYAHKRRETLEAGLQLIEIDYLHASKPVIGNLLSYINKQDHAFPYVVLINDPRPTLVDGKMNYFAWHVDDPLPTFSIELLGDDRIAVDLGQIYNRTFESIRYYHRTIDYAQDPINFDTYTDEDKAKIHKMLDDIRRNLSTQN